MWPGGKQLDITPHAYIIFFSELLSASFSAYLVLNAPEKEGYTLILPTDSSEGTDFSWNS